MNPLLAPPQQTRHNIISLGAGVQSSCLALMCAKGEISPMPDFAVFADTQDEPESVYEWLEKLKGLLPFPIHIVTAGSLSKESLRMRVTKDGRKFSRTNIHSLPKAQKGKLEKLFFVLAHQTSKSSQL